MTCCGKALVNWHNKACCGMTWLAMSICPLPSNTQGYVWAWLTLFKTTCLASLEVRPNEIPVVVDLKPTLDTEGYPPLVFPTMHLMVEALSMHVITVSWDLQYLTCLAETSRSKLKVVEMPNMISGATVSQPGILFYETLKVSKILNP